MRSLKLLLVAIFATLFTLATAALAQPAKVSVQTDKDIGAIVGIDFGRMISAEDLVVLSDELVFIRQNTKELRFRDSYVLLDLRGTNADAKVFAQFYRAVFAGYGLFGRSVPGGPTTVFLVDEGTAGGAEALVGAVSLLIPGSFIVGSPTATDLVSVRDLFIEKKYSVEEKPTTVYQQVILDIVEKIDPTSRRNRCALYR